MIDYNVRGDGKETNVPYCSTKTDSESWYRKLLLSDFVKQLIIWTVEY